MSDNNKNSNKDKTKIDDILIKLIEDKVFKFDFKAGKVFKIKDYRLKDPSNMQPREIEGYGTVTTYEGRQVFIVKRRLLYLAKHGSIPANKEIVALNGDKYDCRISNLAAVAKKKVISNYKGSMQYGSKHYCAVLNETQVAEIKKHLKNNTSTVAKMAQKYGCCRTTIYKIKYNLTWKHVSID